MQSTEQHLKVSELLPGGRAVGCNLPRAWSASLVAPSWAHCTTRNQTLAQNQAAVCFWLHCTPHGCVRQGSHQCDAHNAVCMQTCSGARPMSACLSAGARSAIQQTLQDLSNLHDVPLPPECSLCELSRVLFLPVVLCPMLAAKVVHLGQLDRQEWQCQTRSLPETGVAVEVRPGDGAEKD